MPNGKRFLLAAAWSSFDLAGITLFLHAVCRGLWCTTALTYLVFLSSVEGKVCICLDLFLQKYCLQSPTFPASFACK